MSRHALYRFYGDNGVLLYVGITKDMPNRMSRHAADKHWWSEVRGVTIDWYPDRPSVLAAEARAVKVEQPLHNVMLRRKPEPTPAASTSAPTQPARAEVVWKCHECQQPVLGGDGYVHVDRVRAGNAHRAALAREQDRIRSGASSWEAAPLQPYLERDVAAWEVHHSQCDPVPDGPDYWITTDRISTYRDVLAWTIHLAEKAWVLSGTNWLAFLEVNVTGIGL